MGFEHGWNDADKGKLKCSEINLSWCHFVPHQYHMDLDGFVPVHV